MTPRCRSRSRGPIWFSHTTATGVRASGAAECGCSAAGSASPCQGEGRGFESRHPLDRLSSLARWSGREARQRPAKPSTRVQIPSPPRSMLYPRAIGAAGARFLDTEEVTGSIPVSPTSRGRQCVCIKRRPCRLVPSGATSSRQSGGFATRTPSAALTLNFGLGWKVASPPAPSLRRSPSAAG